MNENDFEQSLTSRKFMKSEPDNLNEAYGNWIEDLTSRYHARLELGDLKWKDWLADSAFFMTLTYDQQRIHDRKAELMLGKHDRSIEWDDFQLIYSFVNERIYGKKWMLEKLVHKLPLTVAAIDFEGSKYSLPNPGDPENAHIHSIWVMPPREVTAFREAFQSAEFKLKLKDKLHVDAIDLQRYDESKASVRKLGSYAVKALKHVQFDPNHDEMLRIYPNRNYGSEPYRVERSYRNESRHLKAIRAAAWKERILADESAR